jgi:hypothetical protein
MRWVAENGGPGAHDGTFDKLRTLLVERSIETVEPPAAEPRSYTQWAKLLPMPKKLLLPDCRKTVEGQPAAKQPVTRANVESVVDQSGMRLRLNMLTREYEVEVPEVLRRGWFNYQPTNQQQQAARGAIRDLCTLTGIEGRQEPLRGAGEVGDAR